MRQLRQRVETLVKRTDASLLLGLISAILAWTLFPALSDVLRRWAMVPGGTKGVGSGFTTE